MNQNAHFSALGNRFRVRMILVLVVIISSITHGVSFMAESFEADNSTSERKVLEKRFPMYNVAGDKNKEKVDEYLARAVVRDELMTDWKYKHCGFKLVPKMDVQVVVIESSGICKLSLKEVFHFLQFFPLLYRNVDKPVMFLFPVNGEYVVLRLQNDKSGGFTAFHNEQDLSKIEFITQEMIKSFKSDNDDSPKFPYLLEKMFHSNSKLNNHKSKFLDDNVLVRNAFKFLASTSILRKALSNQSIKIKWLQNIHFNLEKERKELEYFLNNKIKTQSTTKLQYELTASMLLAPLTSKDFTDEWKKSVEAGEFTLRELFKLLQSFLVYSTNTKFQVTIGGSVRTFYLGKANWGTQQIIVKTQNSDWPISTPLKNFHGKTKIGSAIQFWLPDYDTILKVLDNYPYQAKLARVMVAACQSKLHLGPDFSSQLNIVGGTEKQRKQNADLIRHVVEFLVITMVAEAATPTDETKKEYIEHMVNTINENGHFPEKNEMPRLADVNLKTGRSPTMDDVVLGLLKTIDNYGNGFGKVFNKKNFPVRIKGGTQEGRKYLYYHGDDDIPSYLIQQQANGPGGTFAEKARRSCTRSK